MESNLIYLLISVASFAIGIGILVRATLYFRSHAESEKSNWMDVCLSTDQKILPSSIFFAVGLGCLLMNLKVFVVTLLVFYFGAPFIRMFMVIFLRK